MNEARAVLAVEARNEEVVTGRPVRDEAHTGVRSEIGSEVMGEVAVGVYYEVGNEFLTRVDDKVGDEVGDEVANDVRRYEADRGQSTAASVEASRVGDES